MFSLTPYPAAPFLRNSVSYDVLSIQHIHSVMSVHPVFKIDCNFLHFFLLDFGANLCCFKVITEAFSLIIITVINNKQNKVTHKYG